MLVLTIGGGSLFFPPLVLLFNHELTIFGVPQIVVYLFAIWVLLIIGTALLTRRLPRDATQDGTEGDG